MRCSRRNCSNCCATGGGRRGRGPGCFQARTPSIRCRLASSDASSMRRRRRRESPSACRRTLCGIASPPICSNRTSTSALSRFCSGTPSSRRQRSIPASPSTRSATLPAPWTGSAWTWRGDPRPPDGGRMGRPPGHSPGVADIFRTHGSAWCRANAGHVSLGQLKVMSAIETCRTAALGGHVERCKDCAHVEIADNSCRNRHCPKCQGAAARQWLEAQRDDLLPVAYYHLVFTLPAPIAPIAFHNKTVVYDLLFRAAAETLIAIAANPKHLGARVGFTAVLHTWGSALTHHPHLHMIVPGGSLSSDGSRWIACKPRFFLPVWRCRACSGGCFSKASRRCIRPGGWPSSAISYPLLTGAPSPPRSLRCAGTTRSTTPSVHWPAPQRCLLISLATPIASRSQTAVSSPLTTTASPSAGRIIAPAARRPAAHGSRP